MRTTRMLLTAAVCAAALPVTAQSGAPWFGTPLPPPVSDPGKPVMKYDDGFRRCRRSSPIAPAASTSCSTARR